MINLLPVVLDIMDDERFTAASAVEDAEGAMAANLVFFAYWKDQSAVEFNLKEGHAS